MNICSFLFKTMTIFQTMNVQCEPITINTKSELLLFNTEFTFLLFCSLQIHTFREQLKQAAERLHAMKPVPGKANGVLVLNQALQIEAYVGLMSFLGNTNKLGYCMARGNIGF